MGKREREKQKRVLVVMKVKQNNNSTVGTGISNYPYNLTRLTYRSIATNSCICHGNSGTSSNINASALLLTTVKMNTNKWTASISGDITSIVKRVIVSLPSNSNLILEDISDYNTLQSICHLANANDNQFDSSWASGLNSMSNFNKKNGANQARRYLNLHEEGDARTMVFQLSLSGTIQGYTIGGRNAGW